MFSTQLSWIEHSIILSSIVQVDSGMHSLIYRVDQSGYEQHLLERQLLLCRQRFRAMKTVVVIFLALSNFAHKNRQETEDRRRTNQKNEEEELTGP